MVALSIPAGLAVFIFPFSGIIGYNSITGGERIGPVSGLPPLPDLGERK
jgi:hypothetical protein